jgi:hypothetical protein
MLVWFLLGVFVGAMGIIAMLVVREDRRRGL